MAPSKSAAQKSNGSRVPRGRTKGSQAPEPTSPPPTKLTLLQENAFVARQAYQVLEVFAPPHTLRRPELNTADTLGDAVRPHVLEATARLREKDLLAGMEPSAQAALIARVAAIIWWLEHA